MIQKKIVITGGHLTPALATIKELQKSGQWRIYYFGIKHSLEGKKIPSVESQIIPTLGVEFIILSTGRLQRKFTRYTIPSLLRVPLGFFQALYRLLKIRPDVLLSFGGYVSVPVVIAGWLLKIPVITHEQTVVFGLSSKINALFAQRIAVSFPQSLPHFPAKKVVLTGNPLREEILAVNPPAGWKLSSKEQPLIFITGGNQGSHVINQAVLKILPALTKKYTVLHQTGANDFHWVEEMTAKMKLPTGSYLPMSFVNSEEIGWVYSKAKLVIARAGANTVSELAALGKPALLIPIPWVSQNEQYKNALFLKETGIAEILPEKDLTGESLLGQIEKMLKEINHYLHQPGQTLVSFDGARKLTAELERLSPGQNQ